MLKKIILNVHLYGGLLCFSYLIIFGISSLNFNHPFEFTKAPGPTTTWEQPIELTELPRITKQMTPEEVGRVQREINTAICQAVGVFGHFVQWNSGYDKKDPKVYHAVIARPGKQYKMDLDFGRKQAKVEATRGTAWGLMKSLHGLHGTIPRAPFWVLGWGWYTELCTVVVLFAGVSGVYLWTRRKNERRVGYVLIGAATAFSLGLMLYITLHG